MIFVHIYKPSPSDLKLQYDAILNLSCTSDMHAASDIIFSLLDKQEDIDACCLYLRDPETDTLKMINTLNLSEEFIALAKEYRSERNSWNIMLLQTKEPMFITYPALLESYDYGSKFRDINEDLNAICIVPIIHNGSVIACLCAASKKKSEFTQGTIWIIKKLASDISNTIKRILLEEELHTNRISIDSLCDMTSNMIFICDLEGNIISCNKPVTERLGYTHDEIKKLSVQDIHPPEKNEEVKKTMKLMACGKQSFCNIPLMTKTRELIEVDTQVSVTRCGGKDIIIGISYDIGEFMKQKEMITHHHLLGDMLSEISNISSIGVEDKEVDSVLQILGKKLQLDRTYIFRFSDDMKKMNNTYEWCNQGITPQKGKLQDIECSMFSWWMNKITSNQIIIFSDIETMPPEAEKEKDVLRDQGIISILVVPIQCDRNVYGYMGFDQTTHNRDWSESDIQIIRVVAQLLANFFNRMRLHKELTHQNEALIKKNSQLEMFTSTLFHENQTPLVTIFSYTEELKKHSLRYDDDQLNKYIEIIEKNTKRLSENSKIMGQFIRSLHH